MALRPVDIAMGLAVPIIWGMGFVFAKAAIEHFPPILLMALRFSLTAIVLVWFVRPPWPLMRALFVIAFVSAAIQYSFTFTGLKGVEAGTGGLIVQLEVPFLVILGAVFLNEKPGIKKWLGIALAFIGAGFLTGEPKLQGALVSAVFIVLGAFSWAVGQVMIRHLKDIDGRTVTAWVAVFAAPQLFGMSAIFEEGQFEAIKTAKPIVWAAVIYLGLIMTAIGYGIWYTLIRRHPVSLIAPFLLLLPVTSVIGGIIFLGEKLTFYTALGGAIIIFGVALILIERMPVAKLQSKT